MNVDSFGVFIPILALSIPVVGLLVHGFTRVARLRLEEAKTRAGLLDGTSAADVTELREEMAEVRRELAEVQERLDFAERLLTSGREAEQRREHS